MPKVTDIKAYFKDIASKAGLSDDELKQVLGTMENDKFAKAFTDGFKPLPDYSHDMDDVRNKTKVEKDAEYKTWHDTELKKYNEYLTVIDKAKKYEEVYGPLDNPNPNGNGGTVLSKEEIEKLVKEQTATQMKAELELTMGRRDAAVLDLLDVRESHMNLFKKSLNVKEFEAAWKDHPEWGGSLKLAYDQWVRPEIAKIETAGWEAKIAAAKEEGIRDGFSRRSLPTDHQTKTFSPFFDRKDEVAKLGEHEQDKHSREAFFDSLRDPKNQPVG